MTYANWNDKIGNPKWFLHDRFGMFIHFGLFSTAGREEWLMNHERISVYEYERRFFQHFNPELLDMRDLAKQAKAAGMKYAVLTTKHHEGFCLWDTAYSEYKSVHTPFGRDIVKEYVEAFREQGIKVGFYHSLLDWHHPDFHIDGMHPLGYHKELRKNKGRSMERYREYLHKQVLELVTNYGKIDYIFFDYSYEWHDYGWAKGKGENDWHSDELLDKILKHQPNLIINDRLGLDFGVATPEQFEPEEPLEKKGKPVIWEACLAMKECFGYARDAKEWKSTESLLTMLISTVSNNGNLLLNVSPNGKGELDPREALRLEKIAEWMKYHKRSIYGAGKSSFEAPKKCLLTQLDDRLYVHIISWPLRYIHLKGVAGKMNYAQFLHDHSEVKFKEHDPDQNPDHTQVEVGEGSIALELPINKPYPMIPVIEIFLK